MSHLYLVTGFMVLFILLITNRGNSFRYVVNVTITAYIFAQRGSHICLRAQLLTRMADGDIKTVPSCSGSEKDLTPLAWCRSLCSLDQFSHCGPGHLAHLEQFCTFAHLIKFPSATCWALGDRAVTHSWPLSTYSLVSEKDMGSDKSQSCIW